MARKTRFEKGSSDFDRVANFSDAVFAIAMTLLVVGIGVPKLADPAKLGDALRDLSPEIISFFIGFAVIGFYWRGHHEDFSQLKAVDRGYLSLNLVYLAAIAFIPFPTALVGVYESQPVAFVLYAVTLATASAMGAIMFLWATKHDLLAESMSRRRFLHTLMANLLPVAVFLLSIPIAVIWSTSAGLWWWLLIYVSETVLDAVTRRRFGVSIDSL